VLDKSLQPNLRRDQEMRLDRNKEPVRQPLPSAVERFRKVLQRKSLRWTREREAIMKVVLAREGHFEVPDLVAALRKEGVDASRATVYRALPLLIEAGLIHPTVLSGERHRYEATFGHRHHDHLICSQCDKVVEFRFEAFEILQREVAAKHGFDLTDHFHELIGICSNCKGKKSADA